jgi:hypothetical protein
MPFRAAWRALLAIAALAVPLAAQEEEFVQPNRLSLTLGASLGSAGISCVPRCSADRLSGPTFLARGTGQLSSQFAISIEASTFTKAVSTPNGPGRWTISWYLLGAVWHPNEEEDFFLNAGVGLAAGKAHITFAETGAWAMNFTNVGATVGVGRDFPIRQDLSATLFAEYRFVLRSQALIGRANSGARVAADVVSAGIGFTLF